MSRTILGVVSVLPFLRIRTHARSGFRAGFDLCKRGGRAEPARPTDARAEGGARVQRETA